MTEPPTASISPPMRLTKKKGTCPSRPRAGRCAPARCRPESGRPPHSAAPDPARSHPLPLRESGGLGLKALRHGKRVVGPCADRLIRHYAVRRHFQLRQQAYRSIVVARVLPAITEFRPGGVRWPPVELSSFLNISSCLGRKMSLN